MFPVFVSRGVLGSGLEKSRVLEKCTSAVFEKGKNQIDDRRSQIREWCEPRDSSAILRMGNARTSNT